MLCGGKSCRSFGARVDRDPADGFWRRRRPADRERNLEVDEIDHARDWVSEGARIETCDLGGPAILSRSVGRGERRFRSWRGVASANGLGPETSRRVMCGPDIYFPTV